MLFVEYEMKSYVPYHHKYPNVTPRPKNDHVSALKVFRLMSRFAAVWWVSGFRVVWGIEAYPWHC